MQCDLCAKLLTEGPWNATEPEMWKSTSMTPQQSCGIRGYPCSVPCRSFVKLSTPLQGSAETCELGRPVGPFEPKVRKGFATMLVQRALEHLQLRTVDVKLSPTSIIFLTSLLPFKPIYVRFATRLIKHSTNVSGLKWITPSSSTFAIS